MEGDGTRHSVLREILRCPNSLCMGFRQELETLKILGPKSSSTVLSKGVHNSIHSAVLLRRKKEIECEKKRTCGNSALKTSMRQCLHFRTPVSHPTSAHLILKYTRGLYISHLITLFNLKIYDYY